MNEKVDGDTLNRSIAIHKDDPEMTEVIEDALSPFEETHQTIYSLEIKRRLFAQGASGSGTCREVVPELDGVRIKRHLIFQP